MASPVRSDTCPHVAALQAAVLRRLSGEQRLALAVEMSLTARALLEAGVRRAHPAWSAEQIQQELRRRNGLELPGRAVGR